MNKQNIDKLLLNILNGCADEKEIAFFIQWIDYEDNKIHFENLKNAWHLSEIASVDIPVKEESRKQFINFINKDKRSTKLRRTVIASFSIAATLIAISFSLFKTNKLSHPESMVISKTTEKNMGDIKFEGIAIISTSEDKVIKITHIADNNTNKIVFSSDSTTQVMSNTLIVPKGKRTMIVLPDSTKMWVNSDSRVIYPNKFSPTDRTVEVKGNAFFEVQKECRPFHVITDNVTTTALGTAFEVDNYDNHLCAITLLEGSIRVNKNSETIIVKPGEQITSDSLSLKKHTVVINNYGQWRKDILVIDNELMGSVITKLSRWHNIDIVNNTSGIENRRFTGKFNKGNIDEHLKIISKNSNIKFIKEGEKIIMWN